MSASSEHCLFAHGMSRRSPKMHCRDSCKSVQLPQACDHPVGRQVVSVGTSCVELAQRLTRSCACFSGAHIAIVPCSVFLLASGPSFCTHVDGRQSKLSGAQPRFVQFLHRSLSVIGSIPPEFSRLALHQDGIGWHRTSAMFCQLCLSALSSTSTSCLQDS